MKSYISEFIGTFFMMFLGCGSMILAELNTAYASAFIPVIWGASVGVMIYAVGHISGAHFNPAVTIAFWVTGKFPGNKVLGQLLGQFLGALSACLLHLYIFGSTHDFGMSQLSVPFLSGFVIEIVIAFALMFVIFSVATDSRAVGELAGIAIGSTVALGSFFAGPLTNASMNPFRSLAPAIVSNNYANISLYIFAPLLGAILGAMVYQYLKD